MEWGSEVRAAERPVRVAGREPGTGEDLNIKGFGKWPTSGCTGRRTNRRWRAGRPGGWQSSRSAAGRLVRVPARSCAGWREALLCAGGGAVTRCCGPIPASWWGVCQQAGRAQVRHGTDCIADCLLVRRKFLVVREFVGPAGTLCSPTPWLPGKQGPNCHIAAGAGICAAIITR